MIGVDKRNNLYDKAIDFGKEIILFYRDSKKKGLECEISKQFLRSGTSIGANIAEAQGSVSDNDYLSKIHIAYKELLETRYWFDLLNLTGDIKEVDYKKFIDKLNELSKILYTIIKNIRSKK